MNLARRALVLLALVLVLSIPVGLAAQTATMGTRVSSMTPSPYGGGLAPDVGGEIGLFTIPTGDTLPAGSFSFGLYVLDTKLVAGENPLAAYPDENRFYKTDSFAGSLGYGLTRNIELFASAGEDRFESRGGWTTGVLNGLALSGPFKETEARKLRVGAKVALWDSGSKFRLAIYSAAHAPIGNSEDNIHTRRTDWEFGVSGSSGVFTGNVSYVLAGRRSADPDVRVPNQLRFGVGTDVAFGDFVHWISEIDRNVFDGPDVKPPDYSNLLTGVRLFFGRSGWAASLAVGANVDMLARTHFSPAPLGGLLGVTYAPFPAAPPPPKPLPPPPTQTEEAPEEAPPAEAAPAPPPAPPVAPPAPQPKTTTDVVQFDRGSARLTNIAKAILDGVALRMKNDLNSTATITGFSDNAGSEEANMKISDQRAAAARDYLVQRHGIDAARIKTAAKGSSEPVADNSTPEGQAKNRRAVIVVTFVPGP
jgi:outer membrane protein OmpA-like peptidoglycan-associated protein